VSPQWKKHKIKRTIEIYATMSVKVINVEKSSILFFNTKKSVQRNIARHLGFKIGQLPSKYLGVPLISGAIGTGH